MPVAAWDVPGLSDPLPLLLLETGTGKIKSRVGRYRLVSVGVILLQPDLRLFPHPPLTCLFP